MENLQALAPFEVREVRASMRGLGGNEEQPSLILGTGHRTHLAILAAARRFDCASLVIMKPTIPSAFFDLCLIPEHDLVGPPAENIIATKGMLSRIPMGEPSKVDQGLILLGGPSKHHGFDGETLCTAIETISTSRPDLRWHLTDSRRTPEEFSSQLEQLGLEFHPAHHCASDWLPQELLAAREVWVTEDSMSMIYEALTARARVGLIPMPRKSTKSRVVRGVDKLVADGWTRFFDPHGENTLSLPPAHLHEASRCAREVIKRFFPSLA